MKQEYNEIKMDSCFNIQNGFVCIEEFGHQLEYNTWSFIIRKYDKVVSDNLKELELKIFKKVCWLFSKKIYNESESGDVFLSVTVSDIKEMYYMLKVMKKLKNQYIYNRYDSNHKKWSESVKHRDNYKCQECGGKENIQAHHVKEYSKYENIRYDINNGITLCKKCHYEKHRNMQRLKEITNKNIDYKEICI
ncbi:MAG TPA: HNH endonuclease [Spirochaetota bacterium]|nr:HNH endonuclease [Spirochaetota bacterium]